MRADGDEDGSALFLLHLLYAKSQSFMSVYLIVAQEEPRWPDGEALNGSPFGKNTAKKFVVLLILLYNASETRTLLMLTCSFWS